MGKFLVLDRSYKGKIRNLSANMFLHIGKWIESNNEKNIALSLGLWFKEK
jgi:hypothetical protein